jgi:hypothetical protein
LIIELFRAWTPEDMRVETCGICGHEIAPTPVIADLATDDRYDVGVACPECVGYLGARSPGKSPTREEYEEACRRFPHPMFESEEAPRAAVGDRDPSDVAYEQAWIWQVSR